MMASFTGTRHNNLTVVELLDNILPSLQHIPKLCRDINGEIILDPIASYSQLQHDLNILFASFIDSKLESHPAVPSTPAQQLLDISPGHKVKALIIENEHEVYTSVIISLQQRTIYALQSSEGCYFDRLTDFKEKWPDFEKITLRVIKPTESLVQVYLFTQCTCWALQNLADKTVNLGKFMDKLAGMEVVSMTNVTRICKYAHERNREGHCEIMARKMERKQIIDSIISTHLNMEVITSKCLQTGIALTQNEKRYVERMLVSSVFDKFVEEGVNMIVEKQDRIMTDIPMFIDQIREIRNAKGFAAIYGMVPTLEEAKNCERLASHTEKRQFICKLQVHCLQQLENCIDEKLEEQEVLQCLDACIKCMCVHDKPFITDMPLLSFSKLYLERLVEKNIQYHADEKQEILSNLDDLKIMLTSCESTNEIFFSKVKSMFEGYLKYTCKFREQNILQISGSYVQMSKVISDIQSIEHPFIELRVQASIALFIDCDIHLPGMNVGIIAREIIVVGYVLWDVSGYDGQQLSEEKAVSGEHGKDGVHGESGGNVLILSNNIKHVSNWLIRSNGGRGGNGQHGGDGKDGKHGKKGTNLSEAEFKSKFKDFDYPTCEDFPGIVKKEIRGVVRYEGRYKDGNSLHYSYHSKLECWQHSAVQCCYDFVYLQGTRGTDGERGGDGGDGGCAGNGGHGGMLEVSGIGPVVPEKLPFENKTGKSGDTGRPGKGGKGGQSGNNGMDNLLVTKKHYYNEPIEMADFNKNRDGLLQKVFVATHHQSFAWWNFEGYWKGFYKVTSDKNKLKQAQNGFEGKRQNTSISSGNVPQKNHISKTEMLTGYDASDIFAVEVSIHDKELVYEAQKECAKLASAVQQRTVIQQLQFDPNRNKSVSDVIHRSTELKKEIQELPTPPSVLGDQDILEIENEAILDLFIELDESIKQKNMRQETKEKMDRWTQKLGLSGWTTDLLNKFYSGFQSSSKIMQMLESGWDRIMGSNMEAIVLEKTRDLHIAFIRRYRIVLLEKSCIEIRDYFNTLLFDQAQQELPHYTSQDDVLYFKSVFLSKLLQEVVDIDTKAKLDVVFDKTEKAIQLCMDRARYGKEDDDVTVDSDEDDVTVDSDEDDVTVDLYEKECYQVQDTYSEEFEQRCSKSLSADIAFGLCVMHTCPKRGFKDLAEWILARLSLEGFHLLESAMTRILMQIAENPTSLAFDIFFQQDQVNWFPQCLLQLTHGTLQPNQGQQDALKAFEQKLKMYKNESLLVCLFCKLWKTDGEVVDVKLLGTVLDISEGLHVDDLTENNLDETPIADWPVLINEKMCIDKLLSITFVANSDKKHSDQAVYYCRKLLRENDSFYVDRLIDGLKQATDVDMLNKMLQEFACGLYPLNACALKAVMSNPKEWDEILCESLQLNKEKDFARLINYLQDNPSSHSIQSLVDIDSKLTHLNKAKEGPSMLLSEVNCTAIKDFQESDIREWILKFKNKNNNLNNRASMTIEILAIVLQGIFLRQQFHLRDTQVLSCVMFLFKGNKGLLQQIATGEGKSITIVAIAITQTFLGTKTDIITSSPVLARRDSTINENIYDLFSVTVDHITSADVETRRKAYRGDVVYGDLGSFQRDILLTSFYDENVLGDRPPLNRRVVIVDEVDSMLLDQGQNVLYLSHNIPDFDGLEQLYVYIWSFVHSEEMIGTDKDIHDVCQTVLDNTFGLVQKRDIALLLRGLNPLADTSTEEDDANYEMEVQAVWQNLVDRGIIQKDGTITSTAKIMDHSIKWEKIDSLSAKTNGKLVTFLKNKARQGQCINIPNSLRHFVKRHLSEWVSNAFQARCMREGHHYIIDIDRSEVSQRKNANITIIDLDTGVAQYQSQWNHGLHQFLQLKHGCSLSPESLKAVFMSNIMFFQQYKTSLFGLSGTLGSTKERDLLKKLYDVDYVILPRFVHSKFTLKQPTFAPSQRQWAETIVHNTNETTRCNKRPVLIVCETIRDVERLCVAFENNLEKERQDLLQKGNEQQDHVQQSKNSYNQYRVPIYMYDHCEKPPEVMEVGVSSACVVIATNLAGRGADIKINEDINALGGLHVILSYLPDSSRVEMQAFGRAARKGQQGSGELIVTDVEEDVDIFQLEESRASKEDEHLGKIKKQHENVTKHEEDLFKEFQKTFVSIRKAIEQDADICKDAQRLVLDCLKDKWALWLDSVQEQICEDHAHELMQDLKSTLLYSMHKSNSCKLKDVLDSTSYKVRYAKVLTAKKKFKESLDFFDTAIKSEPFFNESAYYYKAHAMIREGNCSTQSIVGTLKQAKQAMENRMSMWSSLSTIVSTIGAQYEKCSMESFIMSDDFQKQKEEQISIYSSYIKSIDDITGHEVTVQKLEGCPLPQRAAAYAFKKLTEEDILTKPCGQIGHLTKPFDQYELYAPEIEDFVRNFSPEAIKTVLPSREDFWQCLVDVKVLQQESEYIIINKELAKPHEEDQDDFLQRLYSMCEKGHSESDTEDMIWLYPEYMAQIFERKAVMLTKEEFEKRIGKVKYEDSLVTSGLLRHIKLACLQEHKDISLPRYDGIRPTDFAAIPGIQEEQSREIYQQLQKSGILSEQCPAKLLQDDICDVHIDKYWSISSEIENLLRKHFQYRFALCHVREYKGLPSDLALTPHKGLYEVLVNANAVKPTMTNVKVNIDKLKSNVEAALKMTGNDDYHKLAMEVSEHREALVSLLESYYSTLVKENPDSELKPIDKCFDGSYRSNMANEFAALERHGLDSMIVITERKWTWKTNGKIIGILLLGFAQIVAGVLLEVFTLGAATFVAQALIGEGIGDIQFAIECAANGYCSMKDYLIHKAISVAFTVATAGVGALFARGAKFSRFGYKIGGKSMSEVGGKKLVTQTGKVVKDKLVKGQVVRVTEHRLAKEIGKRVFIKTAEAVCMTVVNQGIDYAVKMIVENFIQDVIKQTIKKENIKKKIMQHECMNVLAELYKQDPQVCMSYVHAMKPEETPSWQTWLMKGIGSVASGLGQSAQKLKKCGDKAKVLSALSLILKALPVGKISVELTKITELTMRSKLNKIAAKKHELQQTANESHDKAALSTFLEQVCDQWATEIQQKANSLAGQLLNEAMQFAVNKILDTVKSGIKEEYGNVKERQQLKKLRKLQEAHTTIIKQSQGNPSKQNQHSQDYYRKLNALASESKSPKLIIKVIQEGAPAGYHALQAMANMKGVSIHLDIVGGDNTRIPSVVHPSDGPTKEKLFINFKAGQDGAAGHFYSHTGDPSLRSKQKYDCLFDTVGISRNDVAHHIGQSKPIQNDIRSGFHHYFDGVGGINQSEKTQAYHKRKREDAKKKMETDKTYQTQSIKKLKHFVQTRGEATSNSKGKRETAKSNDNATLNTGNHEKIPLILRDICIAADFECNEKRKTFTVNTANGSSFNLSYTEVQDHLRGDTKWHLFNNNGTIQGHPGALRNAQGNKRNCSIGSETQHIFIRKNLAPHFDRCDPNVGPHTAMIEALRSDVHIRCSALNPEATRPKLFTAHNQDISNPQQWSDVKRAITKDVKKICIVAEHLNGGKPLEWNIPFMPKVDRNGAYEKTILKAAEKTKSFTDYCAILQEPTKP